MPSQPVWLYQGNVDDVHNDVVVDDDVHNDIVVDDDVHNDDVHNDILVDELAHPCVSNQTKTVLKIANV